MFEMGTSEAHHVFLTRNGRNERRRCVRVVTRGDELRAKTTRQLVCARATSAHAGRQRSYGDDEEALHLGSSTCTKVTKSPLEEFLESKNHVVT